MGRSQQNLVDLLTKGLTRDLLRKSMIGMDTLFPSKTMLEVEFNVESLFIEIAAHLHYIVTRFRRIFQFKLCINLFNQSRTQLLVEGVPIAAKTEEKYPDNRTLPTKDEKGNRIIVSVLEPKPDNPEPARNRLNWLWNRNQKLSKDGIRIRLFKGILSGSDIGVGLGSVCFRSVFRVPKSVFEKNNGRCSLVSDGPCIPDEYEIDVQLELLEDHMIAESTFGYFHPCRIDHDQEIE
ncbi:hypothetical protein LXL04_033530 [Taraxacum kok-saghyz]